jgi:hypothetical protein
MESLAAFVATLFVAVIGFSLLNLLLVIVSRRGKIKLWIGIVSNTITGLIAIWAINAAWALGAAPMISVLLGAIILTLPKKSQ